MRKVDPKISCQSKIVAGYRRRPVLQIARKDLTMECPSKFHQRFTITRRTTIGFLTPPPPPPDLYPSPPNKVASTLYSMYAEMGIN